jgi:hypothetical protein
MGAGTCVFDFGASPRFAVRLSWLYVSWDDEGVAVVAG